MTRNDDTYDDLMPTSTNYVERAVLFSGGAFASVGLAGFAVARLPELASIVPDVASIPHLLGLSVFVFALGVGVFAMAFNVFTNSATFRTVEKVFSVYLSVISLLAYLVDVGAFHPRLAVVFVVLLAAGGIFYALFRGGSVMGFGRQNA